MIILTGHSNVNGGVEVKVHKVEQFRKTYQCAVKSEIKVWKRYGYYKKDQKDKNVAIWTLNSAVIKCSGNNKSEHSPDETAQYIILYYFISLGHD